MTNRERFLAGEPFFQTEVPGMFFSYRDGKMYRLDDKMLEIYSYDVEAIKPRHFVALPGRFGMPKRANIHFNTLTFLDDDK